MSGPGWAMTSDEFVRLTAQYGATDVAVYEQPWWAHSPDRSLYFVYEDPKGWRSGRSGFVATTSRGYSPTIDEAAERVNRSIDEEIAVLERRKLRKVVGNEQR